MKRQTKTIGSQRFVGAWTGYCAALWALIFTLLHLIWAAGWYVDLQQDQARKAFQKTWFVVYDLVLLWYADQVQHGTSPTWVVRPWYRRKSAPSCPICAS